jgi:hypothetical protein
MDIDKFLGEVDPSTQPDVKQAPPKKAAAISVIQDKAVKLTDECLEVDNGPKINFKFYFSNHIEPSDLAELPQYLKDVDVFFPEHEQHYEQEEYIFDSIASGDLTDAEIEQVFAMSQYNPFTIELLRQLKGTGIKIRLTGMPVNHPKIDKLRQLDALIQNANFAIKVQLATGGYRVLKEILRQEATSMSAQMELREQVWLERMFAAIEELKKDPEFKDKEEINCLVQAGIFHSDYPSRLDPKKVAKSTTVHNKGAENSSIFELLRQVSPIVAVNGDLGTIDEDLFIHSAIESIILEYFVSASPAQVSQKQMEKDAYDLGKAINKDNIIPLMEFIKANVDPRMWGNNPNALIATSSIANAIYRFLVQTP